LRRRAPGATVCGVTVRPGAAAADSRRPAAARRPRTSARCRVGARPRSPSLSRWLGVRRHPQQRRNFFLDLDQGFSPLCPLPRRAGPPRMMRRLPVPKVPEHPGVPEIEPPLDGPWPALGVEAFRAFVAATVEAIVLEVAQERGIPGASDESPCGPDRPGS